ncbi:MAG TPA: CPBP family glutamic-type intramembrane protease [Anaerolineales bacterium]
MHRRQLTVFFIMLGVNALCAFLTYTVFIDQMAAFASAPVPDLGYPPVVVGLANAGVVIVLYGLLGLAGYWFARRLDLPGIFNPEGDARRWFLIPMGLGILCGLLLVAGDLAFASANGFGRLAHPAFPFSILASISAGIGEEILFRLFVFGLWAFLLSWLFKRFNGRTAALWIANVIAALAFGAGHFQIAMLMTGAASVAELNPLFVVEILLLNGLVGLVAGWRYMKDGLVAASGVHFWTDVVFHVLYGLTS